MRNRKKTIKRPFDWRKFWKKFAIRFAYRAMELVILGGMGWIIGLRLIKI